MRADQFAVVGAGVGAVLMQHPALRGVSAVRAALGGASIGVSDGVLLHVATNPKEEVIVAAKKGVQAVEGNVEDVAKAGEKAVERRMGEKKM